MSDFDVVFAKDERARDPLLKRMLTTGDVFGAMLAEPVDAQGQPIPVPVNHPTGGICRNCRKPMARSWIAFCAGWTPLRTCDACTPAPAYIPNVVARSREPAEA